jgi:hypothetical protein
MPIQSIALMVFVGAAAGSRCALASSIRLSQHPDQHRPKRPVLLAVDQKLGDAATLRVGDGSRGDAQLRDEFD